MSADERERRVEEARAKLAELLRRYDERDAQNGVQRKKITTFGEARAWLTGILGERTRTQAETDRRLDESIRDDRRPDAEQSEGEAGEE